ncbi:MAG: cytochrome c family protein [Nitrospirae bacterium YQR-1]
MRYIMKMQLIAMVLLLFSALGFTHEIPEGAEPFMSSQKCSACHPAIFKEWAGSMHGKSSLHKNSAHAAMYNAYVDDMQKEKKEVGYTCATCHMPMADNLQDIISGKVKPDDKKLLEQDGVGCTFCHRIENTVIGKDRNVCVINKDGSFLVSKPGDKAPHKSASNPMFSDGGLCMGCHGFLVNSKNVTLCAMKEEGTGNCLTCHMQKVDGAPALGSKATEHVSHNISGGHDEEMLKKAVSIDVKSDGKNLQVKIKNNMVHAFPSTMPMRVAYIKVTFRDSAGKALWTNIKENPVADDKQSVFSKAFKGGDKVGVPAWKADAVAYDTRLKAAEERLLTYAITGGDVKSADVYLMYRLFPAAAIEKYNISKEGLNDKAIMVIKKEITLSK